MTVTVTMAGEVGLVIVEEGTVVFETGRVFCVVMTVTDGVVDVGVEDGLGTSVT